MSSAAECWTALAAPLPTSAILWRIDGKPMSRDGKFYARFVAYITAAFVQARLDACVKGEWTFALHALPPAHDKDGVETFAFISTLTIRGVSRDDAGEGQDYKSAASDSLKRSAMRFGIGTELQSYAANWVEVDGDGKYAKAKESAQAVFDRKYRINAAHT